MTASDDHHEVVRKHRYLSTQLKVISYLREGDKLCIDGQSGTLGIEPSRSMHLQFLVRWWNGNSRSTTIEVCAAVIKDAIAFCRDLNKQNTNIASSDSESDDDDDEEEEEEEEKDLRKRFMRMHTRCVSNLCAAKKGLNTLSATYGRDSGTVATIQQLIEEIDDFIE